MKQKKIATTLLAALVMTAFASCTINESDTVPHRTEGEYAVFEQVRALNAHSIQELYMAIGLNEWLRQSTDDGRETVCNRFFPWGRIYSAGEGLWSLRGAGCRYDFILADALPLGDPAASWQVTRSRESASSAEVSTYTLTTNAEGTIDCSMTYGNTYIYNKSDWTIGYTVAAESLTLEVSGSGNIRIEGEQGGDWDIRYEFTEPLHRVDSPQEMIHETTMTIRAEFTGGSSSRLLEFSARQYASGRIEITRGNEVELW